MGFKGKYFDGILNKRHNKRYYGKNYVKNISVLGAEEFLKTVNHADQTYVKVSALHFILLQDFESVSDHFGTLCTKGLTIARQTSCITFAAAIE